MKIKDSVVQWMSIDSGIYPTIGCRVLTISRKGYVDIARSCKTHSQAYSGWGLMYEGEKYTGNRLLDMSQITHWAYIPNPYATPEKVPCKKCGRKEVMPLIRKEGDAYNVSSCYELDNEYVDIFNCKSFMTILIKQDHVEHRCNRCHHVYRETGFLES